ncbi:MAG: hypothetical protein DRI34_13225, partial [Deltaproteobacteria bacterium]
MRACWLGLVLLAAACGGQQPDTAPPQVVAVVPEPGSSGVAADTTIAIQFDEDIDRDSLNDSLFHVSSGERDLFGKVSYDLQTRWATLVMLAPLPAGETVTAVLEAGVRDLIGNRRQTAYSWSFTVAR